MTATKKRKFLSRVLPGIIFSALIVLMLGAAFGNFDIEVNTDAIEEAVAEGQIPEEIMHGTQVVCFYSLVCPYCLKNARWLESRRGFFHLKKGAPLTVIFGRPSQPRNPQQFFDACGLDYDRMEYLDPDTFVSITNGKWPLVLVLKDGRVFHKFTCRMLF